MNADELRTLTQVITTAAEQSVGLGVPINHRRFIYRVRITNQFAGDNVLSLGKRENIVLPAGVTTPLDTYDLTVPGDEIKDPESLREDALPLFIVDGPLLQAAGVAQTASWLRAQTSAGNAALTIWYCDKSAMP